MTPAGLPHSEIPGSTRVNRSPRLIAACHVLRRLPMPRHPPLALSSLSIKPDKTIVINLSLKKAKDKLSYCNLQGRRASEDLGLLYYLIIKDHIQDTGDRTQETVQLAACGRLMS